MAFGKKNEVSLDILSYNIMLLGESGAGKTTLINNVCNIYTGNPDSALFLEIGMERGADAINGINYINTPEWSMDYDELTNSAGFIDVIDDIIDNKTTEYKDLKVVVFDTYDQLINITEAEVLRMWNKECRQSGHPEKCAKTINGCYSGFGRGEKKAIEMMLETINRLRSVNVSTIVIGHVKQRQLEDAFTGLSYQILTSDQQSNYFNAIKKTMHLVPLLYFNREIAAEKTGKKVFGSNKDETVPRINEETRKIRFRDDGAVVDCKSRFANIEPEIDCDANAFIKAIEDAIMAEQSQSGISLKEAEKKQKQKEEALNKRVAEKQEENKAKKELDSIIEEIVEFFMENKTNTKVIKPILAEVKEMGYANPKDIDNLDDAKKILRMLIEE